MVQLLYRICKGAIHQLHSTNNLSNRLLAFDFQRELNKSTRMWMDLRYSKCDLLNVLNFVSKFFFCLEFQHKSGDEI